MFFFRIPNFLTLRRLVVLFVVAVSLPMLQAKPPEAREGSTVEDKNGEFEVEGLLVPIEEIRLAARVEGVVDEVMVREGDVVETGQAILVIDGREQHLRLVYAEEQLKKASKELDSGRRLHIEKLISRNELDQLELEASAARASLELNRLQMEQHTLRSPIDGFLIRLNKKPGESVIKGEPVAEVANVGKVTLIAYLDAKYLRNVTKDQEVRVYPLLGDFPVSGVPGFVSMVDPLVDPGTGIFRVKIDVDNPENKLKSGTRASVIFPGMDGQTPSRDNPQ